MKLVQKALLVSRPLSDGMEEVVSAFVAEQNIAITRVPFEKFVENPAAWLAQANHVVALVDDQDLAVMMRKAEKYGFSLGIVTSTPDANACRLFSLPRKTSAQLPLAFADAPREIDIALCNGDVVLGMLMLGDVPFLDTRSKAYASSRSTLTGRMRLWWRLVLVSLRNLFAIHPFPLTLVTARGVTLHTAVTGLVVIENEVRGPAAQLVNMSISAQDGKLSTLVIAPKSIVEYLWFLLLGLFPRLRAGRQKLPGAVSYIKTSELTVSATQPLTYYVDGNKRQATEIKLRLLPNAVAANLPEDYLAFHEPGGEQKDTMKTENLPENEDRLAMIQKHLPFFTHAITEDFKDLFLLLKDNARIRPDYVTLMILSALVGTLGLFLNSAAVIIGAMVLAPLMSPIISLSMAALRSDGSLFRDAALCIFTGVMLALGVSALIALIVPLQKMTPEIAGRLQPSLLDLGVAIGSGIAGAYAHARESIMKSLPGVAIAVALVPPLCVAGIGIGWLDGHVIYGATLLFMTNLVGITLAGVLTFLVLGFAPVKRARQGLVWSFALMAIIAVPLAISLGKITHHWQIEHALATTRHPAGELMVELRDIQANVSSGRAEIRGEILSERSLTSTELAQLKQHLERELGMPVVLEAGYRLVLQ